MKVLFRAEGSEKIGAGHVMRSIALAQALSDSGWDVTFLFCNSSSSLIERAKDEGFKVYVQETEDLNRSLEYTLDLISESKFDWTILDGYRFTAFYQKAIKDSGTNVLSVDDGFEKEFVSDVILNQNFDAEILYNYSCPQSTKLLLGSKYILLRREFRTNSVDSEYKSDRKDGSVRMLVSFGGADFENCSAKIIKLLQHSKLSNIETKLVIGPCYSHAKEVRALAEKTNIQIEECPHSLFPLMKWCDFALVASGSTVWELAATKTPMVIGSYAQNQEDIRERLSKLGAAISIGDIPSANDSSIIDVLYEISKNYEARLALSKMASEVCDGKGVERVIKVLEAR